MLRLQLPARGPVRAVLYTPLDAGVKEPELPPGCRVGRGDRGEPVRACDLTGSRASWMAVVGRFDSVAAPDDPAPAPVRVWNDSLRRQHISGTFSLGEVSVEVDDRRGTSFRHASLGGRPLAHDVHRVLDSLEGTVAQRAERAAGSISIIPDTGPMYGSRRVQFDVDYGLGGPGPLLRFSVSGAGVTGALLVSFRDFSELPPDSAAEAMRDYRRRFRRVYGCRTWVRGTDYQPAWVCRVPLRRTPDWGALLGRLDRFIARRPPPVPPPTLPPGSTQGCLDGHGWVIRSRDRHGVRVSRSPESFPGCPAQDSASRAYDAEGWRIFNDMVEEVIGRTRQAPRLGVVEGTVSSDDGRVNNAMVTIAGLKRFALSRADGSFRLDSVPAGLIRVRAAFIGFCPQVRDSVRVHAGEVTTADFSLHHECPADPTPVSGPEARRLGPCRTEPESLAKYMMRGAATGVADKAAHGRARLVTDPRICRRVLAAYNADGPPDDVLDRAFVISLGNTYYVVADTRNHGESWQFFDRAFRRLFGFVSLH